MTRRLTPAHRLHAWFVRLRLAGWQAALVGGAAGLLVGGLIAYSMTSTAVFTGPYQALTAGAALVGLWLVIGLIAGLTVLAPLPTEPPDDESAPR